MWVTQGSCIFYISTIFIIEAIADNVKTPQIYLSACQFMGKNSHAAFWIPPTPHVSHLMSSTPNTLCMHCTYFNCFVLWYHLYKYTTIFLYRDRGGISVKYLPFGISVKYPPLDGLRDWFLKLPQTWWEGSMFTVRSCTIVSKAIRSHQRVSWIPSMKVNTVVRLSQYMTSWLPFSSGNIIFYAFNSQCESHFITYVCFCCTNSWYFVNFMSNFMSNIFVNQIWSGDTLFSCPEQLNRGPCHSLSEWVKWGEWVSEWVTFWFWHTGCFFLLHWYPPEKFQVQKS